MRSAAALLRVSAATCLIASSLALTSCGGDDEPEGPASVPTVPSATETTAPPEPSEQETSSSPAPQPETSTATTPKAVPERGGGAVAPEKTPPSREDREESPAERFEKYCDENPGACG